MPGPFPGMDPYLESPLRWPNVHNTLAVYLAEALNRLLPPDYVATVAERCRVVQTLRAIYPDALVKRDAFPAPAAQARMVATTTPTLEREEADVPLVIEALPIEPRETYVDIVAAGEGHRIIATIELLSPDNKAAGEGRNLYLTKQREVLDSRTHLIEIDLLRAGQTTVAASMAHLASETRWDYVVCLHRGGQGLRFEVWPITLRARLPRFTVPLVSEGEEVVVDLQAALDHCYDAGRFARQVNYRQEPEPLLTEDDRSWADTLLRERGLRA